MRLILSLLENMKVNDSKKKNNNIKKNTTDNIPEGGILVM